MLHGMDPLVQEIIAAAHGPDPAALRRLRPFDVGPLTAIERLAGRGARRPVGAALAGVLAAVPVRLAHLRPARPGLPTVAAPCCQPACC